MSTKEKTENVAEQVYEGLLYAVADAYQNPEENEPADRNGHMRIKDLSKRFHLSELKIRRLLVTAKVYQPSAEKTALMKTIQSLYAKGKTAEEIAEELHLSTVSVKSYLPYEQGMCKNRVDYDESGEEQQDAGQENRRTEDSPERERALSDLQNALRQFQEEAKTVYPVSKKTGERLDGCLWNALAAFAGKGFCTATGLEFSYTIRGYEMFVNRKNKSITKSTVLIAFHNGLKLQFGPEACGYVQGPKKLGTFGASYLYPVFLRLGVIRNKAV